MRRGVDAISKRPYRAAVPSATRTRTLVEALLGESLEEWVVARRRAGQSWRSIASELDVCTDGRAGINRETLRSWFAEVDPRRPLEPAT